MKHSAVPAVQEIIVNADDFGYDQDSVLATIECFRAGALTSATIMPKMPATELAIGFARANPQHAYGVHLTFVRGTLESPLADPRLIPALLDGDGNFLPSHQLRLKALAGRIPADQISTEISAQIERLLDSGVALSHVDSHGHLHKFKPFVQALTATLPKYGLSRVRNVQNQYTVTPLKSPTYWMGAHWRRRIMAHFVTTPHFFMGTNASDPQWMEKLLARPLQGALEVGFHPGGPLHVEAWRNAERQACLDFAVQARQSGARLISWKDIATQPQPMACRAAA
jgi:predicted glycoside hydrolase/deacetylase ChbG (UPF0249 family)